MLVLASPSIVQEAHEVGELLFGSAVAVREPNLVALAVAAVVVAVTHGALFKDLVFVSFDGETARSIGHPVARLDAALNLSIAVTVAMATRALGTLPVFAFLVLPAGAALKQMMADRKEMATLWAADNLDKQAIRADLPATCLAGPVWAGHAPQGRHGLRSGLPV